VFSIPGKQPIASDPCQRALDDPSLGENAKAFRVGLATSDFFSNLLCSQMRKI